MTNDQWDDLVRHRVQQAKSDPRGYHVRVWAWALAGYVVRAAEIGYDYRAEHGRHEEAARYRVRLSTELDVLDAPAEERRAARKSDGFVSHDLAPEAVAALSASLAPIDRVAHVYVARKRVIDGALVYER